MSAFIFVGTHMQQRERSDNNHSSVTLTHVSAAVSVCVTDNITNMSQVASVEMEDHLFHRGPAH